MTSDATTVRCPCGAEVEVWAAPEQPEPGVLIVEMVPHECSYDWTEGEDV